MFLPIYPFSDLRFIELITANKSDNGPDLAGKTLERRRRAGVIYLGEVQKKWAVIAGSPLFQGKGISMFKTGFKVSN